MPNSRPPTCPPSYSTAHLARRLGVSVPTVQRWVDLGHVKAWKTVGGHRRIDAESAEDFIRVQATRPDVCLLDIGLPRMDGHELARRLRATPEGRAATLVALTGYSGAADREKATRAGFDHYMVKPPNLQALSCLLQAVARRRA